VCCGGGGRVGRSWAVGDVGGHDAEGGGADGRCTGGAGSIGGASVVAEVYGLHLGDETGCGSRRR
jgi:hypothetical protein